LPLCFNWAPRHEGVLEEWRYSSTHSLTSALDGRAWSASRPSRFTPRERAAGTHWIGGRVGPRTVLDAVVKRKIPSPRRESKPRTPIVQPVAHDCAITAHYSFKGFNNYFLVWFCIAFCWQNMNIRDVNLSRRWRFKSWSREFWSHHITSLHGVTTQKTTTWRWIHTYFFCVYSSGIALGYGLDNRGFESLRRSLGIFFFTTVQTDSGAHRCVKLTTHLHLVPSWRMCGAMPPLPQYAFMARCSTNCLTINSRSVLKCYYCHKHHKPLGEKRKVTWVKF
jgi:hypothetical protein